MRKETQCVHSGAIKDTVQGGVNSPIYTSTAFNYLDRAHAAYPRYFNTPNQNVVVAKVCALEGAEDGVLFSSGMAAMSTAILAFVRPGDHMVMMDELYGGTHALATSELERLGISCTFAATDAESVCGAVTENTKIIVIESPTNPLLSVIDIKKVASFARDRNILSVMDNTFATPIYQNPHALGRWASTLWCTAARNTWAGTAISAAASRSPRGRRQTVSAPWLRTWEEV